MGAACDARQAGTGAGASLRQHGGPKALYWSEPIVAEAPPCLQLPPTVQRAVRREPCPVRGSATDGRRSFAPGSAAVRPLRARYDLPDRPRPAAGCWRSGRAEGVMSRAIIRFRVDLGAELGIGPGKISLLEQIGENGSLSEAARALGMSYRRAWQLLDGLNGCLKEPVTRAQKGGQHGGGSSLTPFGRQLVASIACLMPRRSAAARAPSARSAPRCAHDADPAAQPKVLPGGA